MKKLRLLFITVLLFLFTINSCKKEDVLPQLEITVLDTKGNHIHGAEVKLFISDIDWYNEDNSIAIEYTDKEGKVLFIELEEIVYFFRAKKDTLDNYYSNGVLKDPLKMNYKTKVYTIIN